MLVAVVAVLPLIISVLVLKYLVDRLREQVEAISTTINGMAPTTTTTLDQVKEQEVRAATLVDLGSLEDGRHLTKV